MEDDPRTVVIACQVFQPEVEAILAGDSRVLSLLFLCSMLHMKPELLAARLEEAVLGEAGRGGAVLLVYGDCFLGIGALEGLPKVARVKGNNCCELLLGKELYRRLSHEGVFFLLPEWAARWRHIFTVELGLSRENAVSLMGEMHRKLLYLDTGVRPVPLTALEECSRFFSLPYEILAVSLEPLRLAIMEALAPLCVTGGVS